MRLIPALSLVLSLHTAGCREKEAVDLGPKEPTSSSALVPVEIPKLSFDTVPISTPGPAYLLDDDGTLWMIDTAGTVSEVDVPAVDADKSRDSELVLDKTSETSDLRLTRGPDGRAYVLGHAKTCGALYRLEGATATPIVAWPGDDRFDGFALQVAPEPTLWLFVDSLVRPGLVSTKFTSRWATKWNSETKVDSPKAMAVDGAGQLWIVGRKGLQTVKDGSVNVLPALEGLDDFSAIAATPAGVFVLTSAYDNSKLHRFAPGKTSPEMVLKVESADVLGSTAAGEVIVGPIRDRTLVRIGSDGKQSSVKVPEVYDSVRPHATADVDGRGRVWVVDLNQLGVVDAGARPAATTFFPIGTLPKIDALIRHIVVVGSGPEKLPTKVPTRTGTLRGSITNNGQAMPDTKVALCAKTQVGFFSGDSPCADPKWILKTNAEGVYEARDLPAGPYLLAIEQEAGKWSVSIDRYTVRAGTVTDLTKR